MGVARIKIRTSDRSMVAVVQATAGAAMSAPDLRSALATGRIVHGLDDAAIEALGQKLADATFAGEAVVARGSPPVPGEDGRIEGLFPPGTQAGMPREDGSIDYRERLFLLGVTAGIELGRIVAPTGGTPGTDVHGGAVPAKPGKPTTIRTGAGTKIQGAVVVATRDGVLLRNARTLDVVPLFAHGGDVDYRSGNLHTDGSLAIQGDVREGFAATASGDVQVQGAVTDGTVHAGGGVDVQGGVIGRNATVHAAGDVNCRHATSAAIEAGGTVTIADQATHCRIRAAVVEAVERHGLILGGETRARDRITVANAGSPGGAATLLVVGDLLEEQAKAVRAGGPAARFDQMARQRHGGGGGGLRSVDAANEERLKLRVRQREMLAKACVEIQGSIHPGVRVVFGDRSWTCDTARHGLRLRWNPDDETITEENIR